MGTMPRLPRVQFPGAYYHVYNRGVEQRPIFLDDMDRKMFLKLLSEETQQSYLKLFAYCLMENHYHLFLQITKPNLNLILQALQGRYAQYLNARYDRVGALFQGRYKSRWVNEDQYALTLLRYIHRNPLDANLVKNLEDYRWSSYLSYVGKLPRWNWLETSWVLRQFSPDSALALELFRLFHQTPSSPAEHKILAQLRKPLGNPKGSDPFAAHTEQPRITVSTTR